MSWQVGNCPGTWGCYAKAKGAAMKHAAQIGTPGMVLYRLRRGPDGKWMANPPSSHVSHVNHYVFANGRVETSQVEINKRKMYIDHPMSEGFR